MGFANFSFRSHLITAGMATQGTKKSFLPFRKPYEILNVEMRRTVRKVEMMLSLVVLSRDVACVFPRGRLKWDAEMVRV